MKDLLRYFPLETWHPGDVVMTNDPWLGTGHRPDIAMVAPVFRDGKLAAFSGNVAHAADIGGVVWSADCRSVFEGGDWHSSLKVVQGWGLERDLLETIRYNVRVPDMVVGDIFAQVASLEISGARLLEFLDERDIRDLRVVGEPIQALGERAMRQAIRQLPDGTYHGVTFLDGYDHPLRIEAAITVHGEEMDVDFTGTSDQVDEGGINVPYNYTQAYTTYPLKCLLDPYTTRTSGSFRPIKVSAPEGCILNARYPAAVNARTLTGDTICNVVFEALGQVLPERVIAESGTTLPFGSMSREKGTTNSPSPSIFSLMAVWVRGPTPMVYRACRIQPTSSAPHGSHGVPRSPTRLEKGTGSRLGWCGQIPWRLGPGYGDRGDRREVCDPIGYIGKVGLPTQRARRWPPARANRAEKIVGEGPPFLGRGRTQLMPGEVIKLSFAGGGGFGLPKERDREKVLEDVKTASSRAGSPRSLWTRRRHSEKQGVAALRSESTSPNLVLTSVLTDTTL